jgi:hypothetical protein
MKEAFLTVVISMHSDIRRGNLDKQPTELIFEIFCCDAWCPKARRNTPKWHKILLIK